MAYTWTDILDDIKVRSMMPTSQNTYTEARLLNLTNAVMRSKVLPVVKRTRGGFYSYDFDVTIASNSSFLIPSRAVGAGLENAAFIDGTRRQNAVLYYEEEMQDTTAAPSTRPGFYVKRNKVFIVPTDGAGWDTFRTSIVMRPNTIVKTTDAAQITAINTGTKTLSFTSGTIPTTWTTSNLFDLVEANPHFDWLGIDLVATSVTTTDIIFSATLPTTLVVGDWLSLAGQTPIVQCPVEAHPFLAQEVANVILKAQTDKTAYDLGQDESKMLRQELLTLINPRVEQEGKKLSNRTGILRRGN